MQQNAAPAVATAADTFKNRAARLPAVLQRRGWLLDVHTSVSKRRYGKRVRLDSHGQRDSGLISIKETKRAERSI